MTITHTDGRGNTTTTATDIAGRAILLTDAAGNSTSTTYCTCCDNPATVTDAQAATVMMNVVVKLQNGEQAFSRSTTPMTQPTALSRSPRSEWQMKPFLLIRPGEQTVTRQLGATTMLPAWKPARPMPMART